MVPTVITPTKEDDKICASPSLRTNLVEFRAACRCYELPICVGAFSASRSAPAQSAAACVADLIAHFERHGCSAACHDLRAWHGWDAEMASASRESGIRTGQAPARKVLQAGLLRRAAGS